MSRKLAPVSDPVSDQAPSSPRPKTIRIRKDLQPRIRELLLLQEHHRRLAAEQEVALASLFQTAFGIDLSREHWELDAQRGTLTKQGE